MENTKPPADDESSAGPSAPRRPRKAQSKGQAEIANGADPASPVPETSDSARNSGSRDPAYLAAPPTGGGKAANSLVAARSHALVRFSRTAFAEVRRAKLPQRAAVLGVHGWRHREFLLGVGLLISTIVLGMAANRIISKQNQIVASQIEVTKTIGNEQNLTALLQGFISASQQAGLENDHDRRMLGLTIDLYLELAKDPRYAKLKSSIPIPTDAQLAEILKGKSAEEQRSVLQLFGRTADILVSTPAQGGKYNIAIATFEGRANANRFMKGVAAKLGAAYRDRLSIVVNQRNLYLILLGGFQNTDDAGKAAADLGLSSTYNGVYVTQRRDWSDFCHFGRTPCDGN